MTCSPHAPAAAGGLNFFLRVADGRLQPGIIENGQGLGVDLFRVGLVAGGDEDFDEFADLPHELIGGHLADVRWGWEECSPEACAVLAGEPVSGFPPCAALIPSCVSDIAAGKSKRAWGSPRQFRRKAYS